jgi:hypothetical protein
MKNINIGIVNFMISNKLKDSYFNNNLIEESKKMTSDFINIVKNSPILQLEFKVFDNIENKHIENDVTATRYIDNNIKLFEVYTLQEINKEHEKLKSFVNENAIPKNNDMILLYNAIDNLIKESLKDYDDVDVDCMHESFTTVLNHIKQPKKELVESIEAAEINEHVIEIAVNKFNEKYESLDENDRNLFHKLISYGDNEKEELLEYYKDENLLILERKNSDNVRDNITKAIQKIKEMKYNKNSVNDDIISLHELKKELL